MKWQPPDFDKGADQWSDREIELEHMRANWAKFESENSWLRRYAPIILSAVISAAIAGATIYTEVRANQRAEAAQADRYRNEQASTALRLYFDNPAVFDGEVGAENLKLLRTTTPQETVDKIEAAVTQRANRIRAQAAAQAYSAALAAGGEKSADLRSRPSQQAIRAAEQKRYETLSNSPSLEPTRPDSPPTDFTIYLQYGGGSAQVARDLGGVLTQAGYKVPSIEPQSVAPETAEVRYFLSTQKAAAERLAAAVGKQVGDEPPVRFVGAGHNLPDGILEVWLPPSLEVRSGSGATEPQSSAPVGLNTWARIVLLNRLEPRLGDHAVVALTDRAAPKNEALCAAMLANFEFATYGGDGTSSPPRPIYWLHNPTLASGTGERCAQLLQQYDYPRAATVLDKMSLRGTGPYLLVSRSDQRSATVMDMSSLRAAQIPEMVRYFRERFTQKQDVWGPSTSPPQGFSTSFSSSFARALSLLTASNAASRNECLGDLRDTSSCRN
jgi:hypothetical protein